MTKNLNVSRYRNGDPIPQVTNPTQWANVTTGAWCYNNNVTSNGAVYGKLYNWYAVNDPRGLAPLGFHVPSEAECTTLVTFLQGVTAAAGGKMKETGTTHWTSPNGAATNSSGFTALPGGYRSYNGVLYNIGPGGFWWTSSEANIESAFDFDLNYQNGNIFSNGYYKVSGFSVRCLKD
jgi:uncharacterized protein (TIGR02145 family)